MATQTVTNERRLPLSLLPIAPSSSEQLTTEGLAATHMALDLLRLWIASVEAMDAMAGPCEGDMEALGLTMGAIRQQLERIGDDDVPCEFYAARGTLHSIDLYFSALLQGCTLNELQPDVLAKSACHAYQLLAGVCSTPEHAS